jgi:hypothetical protein
VDEQERGEDWLIRVPCAIGIVFNDLNDSCNPKLSGEETELLVDVFGPF